MLENLMIPDPVLFAVASGLTLSFVTYSLLNMRRKPGAPVDAVTVDSLDERLAMLADRLELQQKLYATELHNELKDLQSDLDWLAGERMIDEAIAMARNGQAAKDISSKLGMPLDAAQTVTRFRKH